MATKVKMSFLKKRSHVVKEVEMVKNVKILQEGLKWLKTVHMDFENI